MDFPDVSLAISSDRADYQLDLVSETGNVIKSLRWSSLPTHQLASVGASSEVPNELLKEIYKLDEAYVQSVNLKKALQRLKQTWGPSLASLPYRR